MTVSPAGVETSSDARTTQPARVLFCSTGFTVDDKVMSEVAAYCAHAGAEASVVLALLDGPAAGGCCGIQGPQWERLMEDHARDALEEVKAGLRRLGCHVVAASVETTSSFAEAVNRGVARWDCDVVVVPARRQPWSRDGLSRRQLRELRRTAQREVVELRRGIHAGQ